MELESGLTFKIAYDYWNPITNMPFPNGWAKFLREDFIENGKHNPQHHYSSTHSELNNQFKYRNREDVGGIHIITEKYDEDITYFYLLEGVGCDSRLFMDISQDNRYSTLLIKNMSPEALKMAQDGQLKIVINYSHEPLGDDFLFDLIGEFCSRNRIPEENIMFFTGCMNINHLCQQSLSKYKFKVYTDNVVMSTSGQSLRNLMDGGKHNELNYETTLITESEIETDVRDKHFICLNRNSHKGHRLNLGLFVESENLWEKFYISFLEDLKSHDKIHNTTHGFRNMEFRNQLLDALPDFIKKTPLELDTQSLNDEQRMCFSVVRAYRKDLYLNSYIYVVTETKFDKHIYFSEKICNPMIVLQPFIVFGAAHFLKYLKKLGFKTFSPFIDESYDDEENDEKRLILLCNLIKKLSKLGRLEIHEWYNAIKDILVHNRNLLYQMSFNNNFENRFIETLNYEKNISNRV